MNERKDILERVKHLMKEDSGIKVNCSKLARQLNCDRRTVSRYIDITRSGKEATQREYPKKTDGFEHIIEEKVKTTAPAIAIYNYLAKEHGYTGSYSTIKRYIHNLNIEKQRDAVKLMNRIKVYSGDITCFDDIRRIASELNREINSSICQATGQKPFDLLKLELPYLIKTNLDILTGYFEDIISRKVSTESMISYQGKKYSVPPKYIGKKVDITDTGSGFDVSFNGHFIRHWEKSGKIMNFNHTDYLEIARNSSLKRLDEDEITAIAERNLEIYDKL